MNVTQPDPPAVIQPDPPPVTQPDPPAVTQPDPPAVIQPDPPAVTQPVLPAVSQFTNTQVRSQTFGDSELIPPPTKRSRLESDESANQTPHLIATTSEHGKVKVKKVVKSGQITDHEHLFNNLSVDICNHYFSIGIELGLAFNVLTNELETGKSMTWKGSRKALEMLHLWRDSVSKDDCTYSVLAAALEKHGLCRIAEEHCYTSGSVKAKKQHSPPPVTQPVPPAVLQPVPPAVTMHTPPTVTQHTPPPITQPDPPPITKLAYNKYLRKLYKRIVRRGPACEDDWPPPIIKNYFNLAMIKEKDVNRYGNRDVYTRKLESGKVEDILKNKVPIELEKISEEMKGCDGKVFLLEGALGCGKSTLALHITKQWEEGKLFQKYEHVVLVKLRDNNVFNAKILADILPKKNKEMGREIEKELMIDDGKHVVFILDGWDELPETAPGHSLIMDILNKEELSGSSILITSRPTSSTSLYKLVDCRIEILGFSQEELKRYFSDNLDCGEKLLRKIQENPAVASSCYVPLYASILVHVFKATGELPKTQYGIFSSLIRNCIYRHQEKIKQPISTIESLDELPEEVKGQFGKLCRLAYEAIMEDRIIFKDLGRDFNTLGLLQGVESLTDGGKSLSHNFLHLSIQELLAALHMATQLNPEQQVAQFRELFGRARFAAVFSFYAAKTKLKTAGMDQVLVEAVKKCLNNTRVTKLTESASDDSDSDEKPKPLLLSLMACLYEAEDETLYHSIVKQFTDSKLSLADISLKPFDCLILGRFLAHCKQFNVDLSFCSIDAEGCKTLFKPDEEYDILSLNLQRNSIGAEGAVAISEAMKTMTNLKELNLGDNSIGDEGAVAISEAMKTMTNLKELNLYNNSIGVEGAVAISEAMKTMTNLQGLYLRGNSIGDKGAVAISEAMKTMTNLKELLLSDNSIGDEGAVAISEAMKTMTNLQELSLDYNSIGVEGAVAISEAMKTMTNLKELDLRNNSIGDEGAVAISEAMKTMTNLKTLDLRRNSAITKVGREAVEEAAKLSGTKIVWK